MGVPTLYFWDAASRKKQEVAVIDPAPFYSLAASPDGRPVLFTAREQSGSDLMLVENFR
jgi:hypothetical protein